MRRFIIALGLAIQAACSYSMDLPQMLKRVRPRLGKGERAGGELRMSGEWSLRIMDPPPPARPLVLLASNSAWSIVQFRQGLLKALERAGYALAAVAPVDQQAPRLPCPLFPIRLQRGGTNPFSDLGLLLQLRRIYRSHRPRAVLHFTPKLNIYGTLACRGLGVQSLVNVSGLGSGFLGGGAVARIQRGLYRLALRSAGVVFFQNTDDQRLFLRSGLARKSSAELLPGSGVDLQAFAPQESNRSGFAFLFIGRLIADKGIREYAQAARQVKQSHPQVRFLVAGGPDDSNPTALREQTLERLAGEGVLDFLGHLEDVRPAISAASCVVLPSYREGTPRSLLEAASMATPLIACDVPGCRQVVEDGVNGFLCRDHDPQDLAAKMRAMLDLTEEERRRMGAAARKRMQREFDEAIVVSKYLDALKRLLA